MRAKNALKQSDVIMTEHERRVNDADIRAYQNVDQEHLHHKIPGLKAYGQETQDKYLEKAFSNTLVTRLSLDNSTNNQLLNNQLPLTTRSTQSKHFQTVSQQMITDQTLHQPHVNP